MVDCSGDVAVVQTEGISVANGRIEVFTIDSKLRNPCYEATCTYDDDSVDRWWLFVIIAVGGAILVLVLVMVVAICYRKRHGTQ